MADAYVFTDNFHTVVGRMYSRDVVEAQREFVLFKIGEGGYEGAPHVPKTPLPTRTDIEGEGEPLAGGGVCEFTNGSAVVTGVGTAFLADVSPGEWIKPGPTPHANPYSAGTPGSEEDAWGQVLAVVDDTTITLSAVYAGATHLIAEGRACYLASEPLFVFRKALGAGDVIWNLATGPTVTMLVDLLEANADQLLLSPEFFEVGIFDSDGVMVAYGTLDERLKTAIVQVLLAPDLVF